MVRIRLRRKGRKNYPVYDVVAVDVRKKRDGSYLERLGYYDPNTSPNTVEIDSNRAIYWLNVGAQPSETVKHILSNEGILLKRSLLFKGLSNEEADSKAEEHKKIALDRYERRKKLRKERKAKKIEAAKKAEEQANAPANEPAADVETTSTESNAEVSSTE